MRRYNEELIKRDIAEKIVILSGPRQVGKTTLAKQLVDSSVYLNYDSLDDRLIINKRSWDRDSAIVIFDELHKMKNWKSWIKGIYDTEGIPPGILITGSARLETYRKGGDSLAGRFYPHRLHPLTVKEICSISKDSPQDVLDRLLLLGGFPEPYLSGSEAKAKRWRRIHTDIIIREDMLDLEKIRDIKSIEILIDLVRTRVGLPISYNSLANDLQVSVPTVKHWLQILENLYVLFTVRPYSKNIARGILKESKYYLYDTSAVEGDIGARLENTVACALLRELHMVEDTTGSKVALQYIRDKEKREVDFLALIDNKPKLLIEVKTSDATLSPALTRFRNYLGDVKTVQVVYKLKRKMQQDGIAIISAAEFLAGLDFT